MYEAIMFIVPEEYQGYNQSEIEILTIYQLAASKEFEHLIRNKEVILYTLCCPLILFKKETRRVKL